MNVRVPEIDEIESPRPAPVKFLHASGSRPLEGYMIKRGVGRGGFGEVYFATSDAGKEVALKLIRRNLEVELRGVTHCLNLKHPNLVALYDIRTDEMGDQWVVMEYVCGESLEQVIERHPDGMPIDEAMWWMRGICGGVAYLHDHGIVHRDLKPGNVFLDEGTVKIGDYGLSKFISCSRRSGQTESVGTVHYMAPEIANGRYGREIDTYALGVMLYEMLTGKVPFEGESVGEVLMKHLTAEPSLDAVPKPFREIVARALAKDPEVRFASVGELLEVLPAKSSDASPYGPASASVQHARNGRRVDPAFIPTAAFGPQRRDRFDLDENSEVAEPIARTLSQSIQSLTLGWNSWTSNPVAKSIVALAAAVVAILTSGAWFSVVATGFLLYCLYYPIWAFFIRPVVKKRMGERPAKVKPSATAAMPISTESAPVSKPTWHEQAAERKRRRHNWREQALHEIAAKPLRDKGTELLGSMLLASVVCVALAALCMAAIGSGSSDPSSVFPTFLWMATVSTLGCWGVLATTKLTEGHVEDQVPPRALQLLFGALLGLAAWSASSLLWIGLPASHEFGDSPADSLAGDILSWRDTYMQAQWHTGSVTPHLAASVGYFALLFVLLRWWRLAEYTRRVRVSIWSIALCGFAAWAFHFVWWFPQPAGLIVAAIIATSTQFASPWMPPSRRRELAARAVA